MREAYLIHHFLEHSALSYPEHLAVIDGERSISYLSLQERAGRIASVLTECGVRPGDRVGIYMTKSIEAVAAIYGALRAGAVYVPLDAAAPPKRIGFMARDCGIRHLISDRNKQPVWQQLASEGAALDHVVVLDGEETEERVAGAQVHPPSEVDQASEDPDPVGTIEDDLAFILYTSGSTGDPKGVMLSHANCRCFVRWAVDEFAVNPGDHLSSHAPFHFDLSTFDLFGAAAAGASVSLMPPTLSIFPSEVRRFIEQRQITVWYSVPSILTLMTEHAGLERGAMPSLRTILFAGEVFPTKYLSRMMTLLPHVEFANLYGPTETNVCTWYRVPHPPDESEPPIPIGGPISNVETFVVDDEGLEAQVGAVGELYVRGPTVMKGYWGDPERTAEKLVRSPLHRHLGDLAYRTGDLVQEMGGNTYRFLGRSDNQVKSRGYRIELGDVESVVAQHPSVVECAVVAVPDEMISNRIVCFVASRVGLDLDDLPRHCAEGMPRYMIPERFIELGALPKTSTGKVDRQALVTRARS
jgi:amino acid adenylation domain-containing protein